MAHGWRSLDKGTATVTTCSLPARTAFNGVARSVFNIDVSCDGLIWERKYVFETDKSFQYPVFRGHEGAVYLTATQGESSGERKERIMFGRLE